MYICEGNLVPISWHLHATEFCHPVKRVILQPLQTEFRSRQSHEIRPRSIRFTYYTKPWSIHTYLKFAATSHPQKSSIGNLKRQNEPKENDEFMLLVLLKPKNKNNQKCCPHKIKNKTMAYVSHWWTPAR